MWKESVVAYFKLSQYFRGRTEENRGDHQLSQSFGRDSIRPPDEQDFNHCATPRHPAFYVMHHQSVWFIVTKTCLLVYTNFVWISLFSLSCCSHLEHRASVKRFASLQFLNLKTVGKTPWKGDQLVAGPPHSQDNTNSSTAIPGLSLLEIHDQDFCSRLNIYVCKTGPPSIL
jgi:hypothetical protein